MFLTPTDLYDLTGYRLGAWQARWLVARGWVFELDAFGRPRVLRAYAEGRLRAHAAGRPRAPTRLGLPAPLPRRPGPYPGQS